MKQEKKLLHRQLASSVLAVAVLEPDSWACYVGSVNPDSSEDNQVYGVAYGGQKQSKAIAEVLFSGIGQEYRR